MQGVIFTIFADMVVEKFGMPFWNRLLAETTLPSGGAYTSGHTYDDREMYSLVGALCEKTGLTTEEALKTFGGFVFPHLVHSLPEDDPALKSFPDLMRYVGSTIHKEVHRINPDAQPPELRYEPVNNQLALLHYKSHRGLCAVCEGIIHSAAIHHNLLITTRQIKCQHHGDDACVFEIHGENLT